MNNNFEEDKTKKANSKNILNKKRAGIIMIFILFVLVIGVTGSYFYVRSKIYSNPKTIGNTENVENVENVTIKPEEDKIEYKEVDGITNVLLIGADGRGQNDTPKSDSIIIATLDSNNKKIKLTSLYRDTLVDIPQYGKNKINAAFEIGGAKLLKDTIRETYDINIDRHIIIDFAGFEAIINKIGGIEVEVKEYQLKELNKYIGEETGGNDCPIEKAGVQKLNGKQTLSYSRIRKGVGDDYERTERQREVLFKVVEKLKNTHPTKYFGIMNSMLNYIDISFEPIEALNMAYTIYKFPSLDTQQLSIPVQDITVDKEVRGLGSVLIMDKYENSKIMHKFIFEDKIDVFDKTSKSEEN